MNAVMTDQIEEQVIKIVSEVSEIPADKITRDSAFKIDLPTDSLDDINIAMKVEEAFNLSVPDDAQNSFKTVGNIIDYVRANVKE